MANSIANQSQVVLGTAALEITRLPIIDHATELLNKTQIVGVYPVKIQDKPAAPEDIYWEYRFDKMVIVNVFMADGTKFSMELQEVSNQPTWSGDLAGQQQCIDDINAWLP